MATNTPRAVFVTRETDYELLLARHATRDQARFFLETRGQTIAVLEQRHAQLHETLRAARAAIPSDWRQAGLQRADLDRFLFGPEDVIVAVGQDGLVANVAKYLDGQPVIGLNPAPDIYDGVLVRVSIDKFAHLARATIKGDARIEERTMVEAVLDNGETLRALNEVFVGHRSHQSARYTLSALGMKEDQSSSGLIVASGTGATGWARSIMEATHEPLILGTEEAAVAFFVREPFPSMTTSTTLHTGKLDAAPLSVTSRMNEGGVIFADGIEQDFVPFNWGQTVSIGPSARGLSLVLG